MYICSLSFLFIIHFELAALKLKRSWFLARLYLHTITSKPQKKQRLIYTGLFDLAVEAEEKIVVIVKLTNDFYRC